MAASIVKRKPCRGWIDPDNGHIACPKGTLVRVLTADLFGQEFSVAGMCAACQKASDAAELAWWARRRENEALAALRLPDRARGWTLASFPTDTLGKAALGAVSDWVAAYGEGSRQSLYLWGEVGGGKTGLAVGAARRLAEMAARATPLPGSEEFVPEWRPPVAFVNFRDLLARIKAGFDNERARSESVQAYLRQPVLVLDDLGAERPTDWAREELAVLIDGRHAAGLVNVVTSNYAPTLLADRLGQDDPVIGERIASRVLDGALAVEVRRRKDRRMA